MAALGATDQHSQVQLYMEGPYDKVVTFVRVEGTDDLVIPARSGLSEELAYLGGKKIGTLLRAEQEATAAALSRMGRMNGTITLSRLVAETLGELFMFFQLATGYAGVWYGVNPFDQLGSDFTRREFIELSRAGLFPQLLNRLPEPGH